MATIKPQKPSPDFPLFPHASGQWAKKIAGKTRYFGPWNDPQAALANYRGEAAPKIPAQARSRKSPAKPQKDFPLFAHASGKWAKKIRGKTHYFGSWDDPDSALNAYLDAKDELLAGRTPDRGDGLTVQQLVNRFLTSKQLLVNSGDLTRRSWDDYNDIAGRVVKVFGKSRRVSSLGPSDFEKLRADFAETHSSVTLLGDIGKTRVLFKYADDTFDIRVKFGQGFKRPSKSVLRKHRQQRGPKMFDAAEVRRIIAGAGIQLRAMVYLAINCGFGNNDCAMLPTNAIDFNGWINFGRPKTGIDRRCALWPETIKALQDALATRQRHKDATHAGRFFITYAGNSWEPKSVRDNPVSKEMAKLLKTLKIERKGVSFYALRHTFQTIGEKSRDKDAVRYIMGHVESNDMAAVYNEERPDDARLKAVADYVRNWLFASNTGSRSPVAVAFSSQPSPVFVAQ